MRKRKTLCIGEPIGVFVPKDYELCENYMLKAAGAELNVAIGMSRLGEDVDYFTHLGNDPVGKLVKKTLCENKIGSSEIVISDKFQTGVMMKTKVKIGDPEIFYYRNGSAASHISKKDIQNIKLQQYQAVHITGIFPALSPETYEASEEIIRLAKVYGLQVSFDPNIRIALWKNEDELKKKINHLASLSDLFLPGMHELSLLTGIDDIEKNAEFYIKSGVKKVFVKLGASGAYYTNGKECGYAHGFKVENTIDTVGAGDGFAAGVLTALNRGCSLADSAVIGNAIGAMQLQSEGDNDNLPNTDVLNLFLNKRGSNVRL